MAQLYRLETAAGDVVADQVRVADNFFARFMGLMGKSALPQGHGLCIQRCNQIHMFFMRIPIDVAFVDGDGIILHVLHSIKPWRVSRMVLGSKAALELPAGTLKQKGLGKGDQLKLV